MHMTLKKLKLNRILFQARVDDYAKEYLRRQSAISFHKFWNNDPYKDYREYLLDDAPTEGESHVEL